MTAVTGTVSSTTGTTGWTNPNNIFTSNNAYAVSASIANSGTTGFIYALGSGFSIPSTATIDGLVVNIEAKNQLSGNGFQLRVTGTDLFLRYSGSDLSASNPSGVSGATWIGTADSLKVFGSATASWGVSLTPAIVNDASFGVRCKFFNLNASAQTFSIDLISITVYYTVAGVTSSQQMFMQII